MLLYFEKNLLDLNKRFFFLEKNFINDSLRLDINSQVNNFNLTTNCNSLDCFFEKTKKRLDPSRFHYQQYTIEFKMEFFKNIPAHSFNYKRNLSHNEVSCLLDFVKRKPFKVVELNKNVGVGIIDKRLYNKLCLEFLSNPDGYEKMDHDHFIN